MALVQVAPRRRKAAGPRRRAAVPRTRAPVRRQRRAAATRVPVKRQQLVVQPCSEHYLLGLTNPAGVEAGLCLPTSDFPLPSQKLKLHLRATMICGLQGFGFAAWRPIFVRDEGCLIFTTAASVGTATTMLTNYTNVTTANFTPIPFTAAQMTAKSCSARFVAGCIRIKYTGRSDALSGQVISLEEQDHTNLMFQSYDDLKGFDSISLRRPTATEEWDGQVNWSGPTSALAIEFNSGNSPIVDASSFPFVCAVSGLPGDTYQVEVWQHCEFLGKAALGKTATEVDPAGYASVLRVVKDYAAKAPLVPSAIKTVARRWVGDLAQIAGFAADSPFSPVSLLPGSSIIKAILSAAVPRMKAYAEAG